MLKKPLFCISLLVFIGCNTGNRNHNISNVIIENDSVKVRNIDSTLKLKNQNGHDSINGDSLEADSLAAVDPDTTFSMHAMQVISNFPEIKTASDYIDSASNHKRKFVLILQGFPDSSEPYYSINAGEESAINDSDDHFVPYMHFDVYKQGKQLIIKYYSTIDDREMSISDWRKKEYKLKKEGKKDWFFVY